MECQILCSGKNKKNIINPVFWENKKMSSIRRPLNYPRGVKVKKCRTIAVVEYNDKQ